MLHEWFSAIELPLTLRQFRQLPRNAAYKYEYFDGHASLSPRPASYQAALDLRTFARPITSMASDERYVVRPLQDADWQRLPRLLAAAFYNVQPFASLTDEDRLRAAQDCISRTQGAGEGPIVGEACQVAVRPSDDTLVGANLVTLPPAEDIDRATECPHLTWIFVNPIYAHQGVGMSLLDVAVKALRRLGHTELASTFLLGNESSMLWHWRAGFRLLERSWSKRVIGREAGTS